MGPGERRRFCPKPPSQPLSSPCTRGKQILVPSECAQSLFAFSIHFAPSEMGKVAHKQAAMAPVGVLGVGVFWFFFSLMEFSPIRVARRQKRLDI